MGLSLSSACGRRRAPSRGAATSPRWRAGRSVGPRRSSLAGLRGPLILHERAPALCRSRRRGRAARRLLRLPATARLCYTFEPAGIGRHPFGGGIAQLGERLAGSQKVTGSSPLTSTIFPLLRAPSRTCAHLPRLLDPHAGRPAGAPADRSDRCAPPGLAVAARCSPPTAPVHSRRDQADQPARALPPRLPRRHRLHGHRDVRVAPARARTTARRRSCGPTSSGSILASLVPGLLARRRASPTAVRRPRLLAGIVLAAAGVVAAIPFVARPFLDLSVTGIDTVSTGAVVGSFAASLALFAPPVRAAGHGDAVRHPPGGDRRRGRRPGRPGASSRSPRPAASSARSCRPSSPSR